MLLSLKIRVSKGRVAFWLNSRLWSLGRNISNFVVLGSGLGKNLNFQLSIKFGWKVLAPYVVVYSRGEHKRITGQTMEDHSRNTELTRHSGMVFCLTVIVS